MKKKNKYPRNQYNIGGMLGGLTSLIPGAGPAISAFMTPALQMAFDKKGQEEVTTKHPVQLTSEQMNNLNMFDRQLEHGGNLVNYEGEKHEQGGITLGINEVEDGETGFNGYIFSDTLKPQDSKLTFAETSKKIQSKYKGREHDKLSQKSLNRELETLKIQQESMNNGYNSVFKGGGFLKGLNKAAELAPIAFNLVQGLQPEDKLNPQRYEVGAKIPYRDISLDQVKTDLKAKEGATKTSILNTGNLSGGQARANLLGLDLNTKTALANTELQAQQANIAQKDAADRVNLSTDIRNKESRFRTDDWNMRSKASRLNTLAEAFSGLGKLGSAGQTNQFGLNAINSILSNYQIDSLGNITFKETGKKVDEDEKMSLMKVIQASGVENKFLGASDYLPEPTVDYSKVLQNPNFDSMLNAPVVDVNNELTEEEIKQTKDALEDIRTRQDMEKTKFYTRTKAFTPTSAIQIEREPIVKELLKGKSSKKKKQILNSLEKSLIELEKNINIDYFDLLQNKNMLHTNLK